MNLEYQLGCRENFKNIKLGILFQPISHDLNTYKMMWTINKDYNLIDYGEYFVPYYYATGPFGGKVLQCETYMKNYREHENRIKKQFLNKFIATTTRNKSGFYGYFENISKANREYNLVLKPYLLKKFIPYEGITDKSLIETIEKIRFR